MIDFMTELNYKRGKQIDKVYEYWNKASEFYVALKFGAATSTLVRLRDYLNKVFPRRKGGEKK